MRVTGCDIINDIGREIAASLRSSQRHESGCSTGHCERQRGNLSGVVIEKKLDRRLYYKPPVELSIYSCSISL